MAHTDNTGNSIHHLSKGDKWVLGGAAALAGLIVAPYALTGIGLTTAEDVTTLMTTMHGVGDGTGFAGWLNSGLAQVPGIGPTLAAGSIWTAVTAGAIGFGGMWLANYLEKREIENGGQGFPWSRVVRYGALATSALVALPSILSGISLGVTYLAALTLSTGAASSVLTFMANNVGTIGAMGVATSGAGFGVLLSHLLTCGVAIVPMALSYAFGAATRIEKPERLTPRPQVFVPIRAERAIREAPAAAL
jgi:hypothetical protein